jgi:hypothetical protein
MSKKVNAVFESSLFKNPEKGGAWLASVCTHDEGLDPEGWITTAWSNASAGKRWIKEQVIKMTPRKSVKMTAGSAVDAKGKPTKFIGILEYKREA